MTATTILLVVSRFRAVEALPRFSGSRFGFLSVDLPPGFGSFLREVLTLLAKVGKASLAL